MSRDAKNSCSPYLLRERRDLANACREISRAHGQASPACDACGLRDVCRYRRAVKLIALPRPRGAPSNDSGPARAA